MSVETSRMSQSDDGDPDDSHRTFAFRSADSAADDINLDDDDLNDDDLNEGDTVVYGTVVDEDAADRDAVVADADDPQPTFTPADDETAGTVPYPNEPTLNETDNVPVVADQATTPVSEAPVSSAVPLDPNAPLLGDSLGLRASWQQAQAGFVDDPRAAVADAAELVEHTAQTLIGSLQQRQRQLRTQWDNNGSGEADATATGDTSDTERLRHLMQDYRSLFNQLCQT